MYIAVTYCIVEMFANSFQLQAAHHYYRDEQQWDISGC